MLDRRSQQLLTRLPARVAAGQPHAELFKPGDPEAWFAISSTMAQEWLKTWQGQGCCSLPRRASAFAPGN